LIEYFQKQISFKFSSQNSNDILKITIVLICLFEYFFTNAFTSVEIGRI
jgi:hypothetical protein